MAGEHHRHSNQNEAHHQPDSSPYNANVFQIPQVSQSRRRNVKFADPPTLSTSSSFHVASRFESGRKPYSPLASQSAIDDPSTPPPSPPSHSIARERKRHTALPDGAERFQDSVGRARPHSEATADPTLRPRRTFSTSGAHPAPVNANMRLPAECPRPET